MGTHPAAVVRPAHHRRLQETARLDTPIDGRDGGHAAEPPGSLPVYLIHWDAPEWCASAARSVLASTGIDVDLTIVDNGQRQGPPLSTLLPPGARILPLGINRGYAGGANAAIADWRSRHAGAGLAVVGSHDLHVAPGALALLAATARARPATGVVAPAIIRPRLIAGGAWDGRTSWQVGIPDGNEPVERQWASGTCLLLRRECVAEVGAFDERLGSYMEDVDYGLRANDRGWKVTVVPAAQVWGLGSSCDEVDTRVAVNTIVLAAKRGGPWAALSDLALFGYWSAKGFVGSVAPWRPPEGRQRSLQQARERAGALARLGRSRILLDVLRDRSGRRPRA